MKMEVLVEYYLVLTVMRILSGFAAAAPRTNPNEANTNEAATSSCEIVQIPQCSGIGYDL